MKILIVGGGIAGPTLAAFLKRDRTHQITLVERAPEFRNIGYMVGIWGNGRRVLRELGVDQDIIGKEGYEVPYVALENRQGKILKKFDPDPFRRFGAVAIIHRALLHQGIVSQLEGLDVRLGTTVVSMKQAADNVTVKMSDGKEEVFNMVVGADGTKSSIREMVFGKNFLQHYGWGIWGYWLPKTFTVPPGPTGLAGPGKFYAFYPNRDSSAVFFVATVPPGSVPIEKRRERLMEIFQGFNGSVEKILQAAPASAEIFYDDLAHIEMPTWHKGRVLLIGDAQHAASPIAGMGASMAMEDAFVLADELKNSVGADVETIFKRFEARRNSRVRIFRRAAERIESWSMAPGLTGLMRDILLPLVPQSFFFGAMMRLVQKDL